MKTIRITLTICFFCSTIFLNCCQNRKQFDPVREKQKLSRFLSLNINALVDKNPSLFKEIDRCCDSTYFLIGNGTIQKLKNDFLSSNDEIFEKYGLNRVTYTSVKINDTPIFSFSNDGSMSTIIGSYKLNYTYKDSIGNAKSFEITNAFLWVFVKKDTCWSTLSLAETMK